MSTTSRSERLLRDTLRRDAASPKKIRPTSTPPQRPRTTDPEYTSGTFLFRSAITPTFPRSDHTKRRSAPSFSAYTADSEDGATPRSHSPASTHSRTSSMNSALGAIPLTPPEQALRARLERALRAGHSVPVTERERPQRTDRTRPHVNLPYQPRHSKTDPPPTATPHTPPRSRSHSYSQSHPRSHYSDTCTSDLDHHPFASPQQHEPLTPPPTPPLRPSLFNARQASARCRQMEGYVSFAAVEGLGEPPGSSLDDEDEDKRDGKAAELPTKAGLVLGIGRIWKVLGDVGRLTE